MVDFQHNDATVLTDNRTVQYPSQVTPPPVTQLIPPTFFAAYAPTNFPPRYPSHPQPFQPPLFETLPSPALAWDAEYPDRLERPRALSTYPQPVMNLDPIAEAAPETGERIVYPNVLRRERGLWPMPYKGEGNIDPINDPFIPDFERRAFYPDRLERARALKEYPQPVMNLEPIPGVAAPDFFGANIPARLNRLPPPFYPQPILPPTSSNFLTLDDYSRGLHVGDTRGFYHTPDISTCEPHAVASFGVSQTFTSGATGQTVDLTTRTFSGLSLASDPWSLVNITLDRIRIKYSGYYIVTAYVSLTAGGADFPAEVQLIHYADTGVRREFLCKDRRVATNHRITISSPVRQMIQGDYVQGHLIQISGGDLTGGTDGQISIVRVAGSRTYIPIPS